MTEELQNQMNWLRSACATQVSQHTEDGCKAEEMVLGYYEYGVLTQFTRQEMIERGMPEWQAMDAIVTRFLSIPVKLGKQTRLIAIRGHYGEGDDPNNLISGAIG